MAVPLSSLLERGGAKRRGEARGGPRSAAGKARSSQNAWKHGLRARKVLVRGEDAGDYAAFRTGLFQRWAPRDDDEAFLVHRMAGAAWRLMRCPEFEAELLESLRDADVEQGGFARAFLGGANGADGSAILRFARYESELERSYLRCRRMLQFPRMFQAEKLGPAETAVAESAPVADEKLNARWEESAEAAQVLEIEWPEEASQDDWDDDRPPIFREVILDSLTGEPIEDQVEDEYEPVEVRETILDGDAEGSLADEDFEDGDSDGEDEEGPVAVGAALGGRAGQRRTGAAKLPNELKANSWPPRDWPGEPDYVPRERAPQPVSRVIAGPIMTMAEPD